LLEKIRGGLQLRAAARQNGKKRIMEIKRITWKFVGHALRKGNGSSEGHAWYWNPLDSRRRGVFGEEKSMRKLSRKKKRKH
jgi:hypothetical protein